MRADGMSAGRWVALAVAVVLAAPVAAQVPGLRAVDVLETKGGVKKSKIEEVIDLLRAIDGQEKKKGGQKKSKVAGLIDIKVELMPGDVFSDDNQVGRMPKVARPGELLRLTLIATPKPGFHTYPMTKRTQKQDEGQLTRLEFGKGSPFKPVWPVTEDEPVGARASTPEGQVVILEHKKKFRWSLDVLVDPGAKPGPANLDFTLDLQVCNDRNCIFDKVPFSIPLTIQGGPPEPVSPGLLKQANEKVPGATIVPPPPVEDDDDDGVAVVGRAGNLWAFILQGIFWGAISLVTPCVFPMIPITVSLFLKQSEQEHHRPLLTAFVYCGTIIVVLTASAVALLSVFQQVSTHPVTNILMGGLFLYFAFSLFGAYEIELPSWLSNFTAKRQDRGGVTGTIFMGLTFTIISFACVAPFLGGFGGTATAGGSGLSWTHRILGGLAFSATFASPFFILALFPSLLRKLPRSGTWLNSVKVVMGFLELAAALKFLRSGELAWLPEATLFTFDFVLGLYVAIAALAGLYLLGAYRLPHDTPLEHLSVMRMILGLGFLGLAVYLAPGLMKGYNAQGDRWDNQRPNGMVFSWVESFLLPDAKSDLPWERDLDKALRDALQADQLVFLDFTGVTCSNCNWNEQNVFTRKEVKDLLLRYRLVQLYTDRIPKKLYTPEELEELGSDLSRAQAEEGAKNRTFQAARFNDARLPLYVILQPLPGGEFRQVAIYNEGKINSVAAFLRFLREPLRARSN